jgi:hypothetical protein
MSRHREIKRSLRVSTLVEVTGCGDHVTYKLVATRETKGGTFERYTLNLEACRHSIRQLLTEIRRMHHRDRERLQGEQNRIDREIRELTQEQG